MKKLITLSSIGGILIVGLSILMWGIGVSNTEVRLRNEFDAQVKANQTDYDNLWKTISQKYQLSVDYKDAIVQVTQAAVQGRTGGSLFKSVQEAIPGVDASVIKDVSATIEGKRNQFEAHQKKMLDIDREHKDLCGTFPRSMIVGGRPPFDVKMVTSTRTNDAFISGKDDDVSLGNKKK